MGFWETLAGLAGTAGGGVLTALTGPNPLSLGLTGAGIGALKSSLQDQPQEDQDKYVASETMRYQPLTGIATPGIRRANFVGDVMGGGFTGAALGQGLATKAVTAATPALQGGMGLSEAGAGEAGQAGGTAAAGLQGGLGLSSVPGTAYTGGVGSPSTLLQGLPGTQANSPWLNVAKNFNQYRKLFS